jgi:hypothetical protein
MALIQFVQNYDDLSNGTGFQFKFYCDRCHNGYMSNFEPNRTNATEGILRSAGGLLGGLFGKAAENMQNTGLGQFVGGREHDAALQRAIAEVKGSFKQCPRCGTWVCPEVCWNAEDGECTYCTPKLAQEVNRIRSDARIQQLQSRAYNSPEISAGIDIVNAPKATCLKCGAAASGGKFCQECGAPLGPQPCKNCGKALAPNSKFCSECGTPAS